MVGENRRLPLYLVILLARVDSRWREIYFYLENSIYSEIFENAGRRESMVFRFMTQSLSGTSRGLRRPAAGAVITALCAAGLALAPAGGTPNASAATRPAAS